MNFTNSGFNFKLSNEESFPIMSAIKTESAKNFSCEILTKRSPKCARSKTFTFNKNI